MQVTLSDVFKAVHAAKDAGLRLDDWAVTSATLEEVFIKLARVADDSHLHRVNSAGVHSGPRKRKENAMPKRLHIHGVWYALRIVNHWACMGPAIWRLCEAAHAWGLYQVHMLKVACCRYVHRLSGVHSSVMCARTVIVCASMSETNCLDECDCFSDGWYCRLLGGFVVV
eukprot:1161213-Pelagomonas_calceolata.AAC.19